jgi:valyl-tRNA synthetase
MEESYDYKEVEPRIADLWEKSDCFTPRIEPSKRPFSIYLTPPNASGPMHVGNALMVAIQDVLARYHRAAGEPTLWIPSIDHGGYETQVTFEKKLEASGDDKANYTSPELFSVIKKFVDENSSLIKSQIKRLGASVDWTRFRFTMDKTSLKSVAQMFGKMVSQNLIYRRPYMVHYCASCSTLLSDIELKEVKERTPEYFIKFSIEGTDQHLILTTTRPEFLFAATHVLVHPHDEKYAGYIGKILINPTTGNPVKIVASKRKFDPKEAEPFLSPFSPSYDKYDYEYTLRNDLPSRNLLDWEGKLVERYPGDTPAEARAKEVTFLEKKGFIEHIDQEKEDSAFFCKKEHRVENLVILTWFLKFDDEKTPLRKPGLDAIKKEGLVVLPRWREKGLLEWISKMPDWPIARQNVWGIKIPVWYEISDSSKFIVWFIDRRGERLYGVLKSFLDQGISIDEISVGLERIYATAENARWTLDREPGKLYLPETDSFDTWFSSGQWSSIVFGDADSKDFAYFYPSQSIVLGYDLIRLSIARELVLSQYLTGKLPFKVVYFHRLIKGNDNRKMSKSFGNVIPLEFYLDNYGVDVTRMALISYTVEQDDFILAEERLAFFKKFASRLWELGYLVDLINEHPVGPLRIEALALQDKNLITEVESLAKRVGSYVEKYSFTYAEDALCDFLALLEGYARQIEPKNNVPVSLSVLGYVYKKYITLLHPFMPFMTEELNSNLYQGSVLLAETTKRTPDPLTRAIVKP